MTAKPFELWLIWQNQTTRQRYHIGRLVYENNLYSFQYETAGYRRNLGEALDNGYLPHMAFPNTEKVYKSEKLFGPFARRLPDPRRPDYESILQDFGLTFKDSDMDILQATGGILATDSYEFVSPIVVEQDTFHLDFFIAGWRYYEGPKTIEQLKIGETLQLELDPLNPKDHKAVKVKSKDGHLLGYIPAFYSGWMYEIIEKNSDFSIQIRNVHLQAVPHRKIEVSINGSVNQFVNIDSVRYDTEQLRLVMCS